MLSEALSDDVTPFTIRTLIAAPLKWLYRNENDNTHHLTQNTEP
jgi:hypothetical protein